MTSLSCLRAGLLLERRASGLGDGDRLLLEEHLSRCDDCAGQARVLARATELTAAHRWPLSSRAQNRAIEAALDQAGDQALVPNTPELARMRRPLAMAAVVVAVMAVVVGAWWPDRGEQGATLATALEIQVGRAADLRDHLLTGGLTADGSPVRPGHSWAPGALLSTETGARLWLGHALVRLSSESGARWEASRSTLSLLEGTVEVAVDGSTGQRFAVSTQHFEVEVVGTHFSVGPSGVEVFRGRVRVFELPSGRALADLEPGQRWSLDEAAGASAAASGAEPTDSAAPPTPQAGTAATKLLARARSQLAGGQVGAARRTVASVLAKPLSPTAEAEAHSLLAECALLGGDDAEAARKYAQVANQFPGLPAGETALFAAARAQQQAEDHSAARASLRSYLKRYPNGRFAGEARRRLATLSSKGQSP